LRSINASGQVPEVVVVHLGTNGEIDEDDAHEFFELSLKRNAATIRIECSKGCAFCCYVPVSALAPEPSWRAR